LKITKVAGYQNYDKSEFAAASPLLNDDDQMEKIWKSELSLKDLTAAKEFKTYDELKNRLEKVLGMSGDVVLPRTTVETFKEAARTAPRKPAVEDMIAAEDDDLAYISKLAED
jgi:hypothetical protein